MIAEDYFIGSGVSFPAGAVMILLLVSLSIAIVDWCCAPTDAEKKASPGVAVTSTKRK
jgi:hypothetical protein